LILILCFVLTFAGCGKTETETIKPVTVLTAAW
jgi:hypothetical protein